MKSHPIPHPQNLQEVRANAKTTIPHLLENPAVLDLVKLEVTSLADSLANSFPKTGKQPVVSFKKGTPAAVKALKVGVVFSGGQASGGHNVIIGLYDCLKKLHPNSCLYGFLDGPKGLIEQRHWELTQEFIAPYMNQGGFDMLGSGRTKIETPAQFEAVKKGALELDLDGIVIIGGDDSNTIAAHLAEYFANEQISTRVVGVPKTIDGDLKNSHIEISFGFDTASKTFAESIGSVQRDALSAKKYTFFIKLMGRTASHLTLECALQTHPNLALIGEEIAEKKLTLKQVTEQIRDLIETRHKQGKDYGVILIPEGIIEFIPEIKTLIAELNQGVQPDNLTPASKACLDAFPSAIRAQFLLDRDPHGNVQVSKIETERLFIELVKAMTIVNFNAQPLFFGYEGRACMPSNFDANYGYALGMTAALLVARNANGYVATLHGLKNPVSTWQPGGTPLANMMILEKRQGKLQPVIAKAFVDLQAAPFKTFAEQRDLWATSDDYRTPGPIQFYGPFANTLNLTLTLT